MAAHNTTMKKTVLVLAMALLALAAVASAKDYTVTLQQPAAVGNIKLDKGQYTMKLTGALAFFNDTKGHSLSTVAKQEKTDTKYESTRVETSQGPDGARVTAIGLDGCDCKLTFGN
jgi:hypothetical protein